MCCTNWTTETKELVLFTWKGIHKLSTCFGSCRINLRIETKQIPHAFYTLMWCYLCVVCEDKIPCNKWAFELNILEKMEQNCHKLCLTTLLRIVELVLWWIELQNSIILVISNFCSTDVTEVMLTVLINAFNCIFFFSFYLSIRLLRSHFRIEFIIFVSYGSLVTID